MQIIKEREEWGWKWMPHLKNLHSLTDMRPGEKKGVHLVSVKLTDVPRTWLYFIIPKGRGKKGGGQFISTGVKTCNHLGCTLLGQWSKHATRNSSSFISGPSSCHSKTAATQTTAQIPTHRVIPTLRYCDMLSKIPWDVSVQSHYMVQLKYSNTEKRLLWLPLGLTRRKLFTWILEMILRIHIETYIKPRWIKGKTYSY